jgi:DNA polymerase-1
MQVHDELILEVPDNELEVIQKNIPSLMTNALTLTVPLIAEIGIGKNWGLAH